MNIAVLFGEVAYISRSQIINGIVDSASRNGDNVILFTCEGFLYHHLPDYSSGEYNLFNLPVLEQYDGIIIDLDSIQNEKLQIQLTEKINTSGIPCVSFNSSIGKANEIYFENEKGFKKLLEHLIKEHKLTDIHYISGPYENRDALQRKNLFVSVLEENGLKIPEENIYEGDFNFGSGKFIAQNFIKNKRKLPQAFVAANDYMAIGLMEELKSSGVKIPDDVIVTGYDNSEISMYTYPRLTTVNRKEYESGVLAYNRLINSIKNNENSSFDIIEGEPVIGGTCGCTTSTKTEITAFSQSVVDLKMEMDESLDMIKKITISLSGLNSLTEFEARLENNIERLGIEYFYYCQCGSRESYYDELETIASGKNVRRNISAFTDTVWCPIAFENGEWHTYPSFDIKVLFPPACRKKKESGYYIVMPVHKGELCIGYTIFGNFKTKISGRVLQHLLLGIDEALGNIREHDIMVTMLARINQKWQYDELTGLYNRSGMLENAEKLIEEAVAENCGISVSFFDLDGLKTVNDTRGHEAGDEYIKSMANMLLENTQKKDVVTRYGGDEYIVISKQISRESSLKALDKIEKGIKDPVSASAGCVFEKIKGMEELHELIEKADKKMYEVKQLKKNYSCL